MRRLFHIVPKHQRHAVTRRKTDQLFICCLSHLAGREDDGGKLAQAFPLFVNQQFGIPDEIYEQLTAEFTLTPHGEPRGSAPAELFIVDGGPATVGIIASVTRPFCGDCDRVRLTADGQVRNCLFAREESDLRTALRSGAEDEEIAERWVIAMLGKRAGHGIDDETFLQPDRPMSAIGG
jgi:molybdenum cofactor biosynthesis enzyme MoaA